MEYALVDMQGSTLDVYEDLETAKKAVKALLKDEPVDADELVILTYAHQERIGLPIPVQDFVAPRKDYLAQVIASYLEDWTPEISLSFSSVVNVSEDFEIKWEAEETEPDVELLAQPPRLALC